MRIDIDYIYNKVYRTALMMLCSVSFFSCVKVDVCSDTDENGKHIHTGKVKIAYHWEGVSERPDSMLALVSRVINSYRIGYVTGSESSVDGRYLFGKDSVALADAASTEQEPLIANAGDYQAFAFNVDDVEGFMNGADGADYRVNNLREFGDGEHLGTVDIRDIGISYVGRSLDEKEQINLYAEELHSFNPELKYIATDIRPIYCAANSRDEDTQNYTFGVSVGGETVVELYPQTIMQDIAFSFPVYTADNVTVGDTLIAEISGVPHKMMLYTGLLDIDTVYKMQFKVGVDVNSVKDTTINVEGEDVIFKKRMYSGAISVMGLVPNNTPMVDYGAGILLLCVDVNGDNRYAKINLYNTLGKANLLLVDPQGTITQNDGSNPKKPKADTLCFDCRHLVATADSLMLMPETELSEDEGSVDSWTVIDF